MEFMMLLDYQTFHETNIITNSTSLLIVRLQIFFFPDRSFPARTTKESHIKRFYLVDATSSSKLLGQTPRIQGQAVISLHKNGCMLKPYIISRYLHQKPYPKSVCQNKRVGKINMQQKTCFSAFWLVVWNLISDFHMVTYFVQHNIHFKTYFQSTQPARKSVIYNMP